MTVKRRIEIGAETCILGYGGRDYVKSAVFDASTLTKGGVDEVQTVTITGSPTGGNFKLKFKGAETANIAFNAAASAVQTALVALSTIDTGDVTVTGSAGGPYTVTFGGRYAKQGVPQMTADAAGLTGGTTPGVTVAETTAGSADDADLYVLNGGVVLVKTSDGKMVKKYTGTGVTNEVQTLTITGSPTGGTFRLNFDGEETANINFDDTAAEVQTALEGLPNVDAGDVTGAGGALPGTAVTITFGGQYEGQSVPLITVTNSALTGGTTPAASVAQTTQGVDTETIVGVFDGRWEFITNTREASRPVPVYGLHTVFDETKVKDFDANEGVFRDWARDHFCEFRAPTA